jgi:aminopeptidase N
MNRLQVSGSAIAGIFLLLAFQSALIKAQDREFEITRYSATITPNLTLKSVSGEVSVEFIATAATLSEVALNAGGLEIDSVRERNRPLVYRRENDKLLITLNGAPKINELRKIHIVYHGTPKYGIKFFADKPEVYTVFSTSQWMPCIDAPNARSKFRLELVVPKEFNAVGNGRLIGKTSIAPGLSKFVWDQSMPAPSYLFGFAAGNFREVGDKYKNLKLRYLAPPEFSESEIRQIFKNTADMIGFFEGKSGVKYPFEVYTQILAADGAEQEMSGFAALNEEYGRGVLKDESAIWLGAHETAHQWWGNMVTNRAWTHFWLNEGIATFMTAAYLEHRFGSAVYEAEIEKSRARYEKVRAAGKDRSLVFPDWNKPTREDRILVYQKGAYVIHLLRRELGDDLFWKCFKDYTKAFWGKSVTTADFQKSMEKSSGKDLSAFFNKWVYDLPE